MVKKWNDGSYYGQKTRNYFRKLDKKLNALLDSEDNSPEHIESIVKLAKTQSQNIHSITKLIDTMDTNQRLQKIEDFMNYVPNDTIDAAVEKAKADKFKFE